MVDHRLMTGCMEPPFRDRPGYRHLCRGLPGMRRAPTPDTNVSSDARLGSMWDSKPGAVQS
jgi:hypothetical protein